MVPQLCSTFVYITLAIGLIKADPDYQNYCADEGMEEIEFNNNPVHKLIKKSAKNVSHINFLKKCLKAGVAPNGLNINKKRYHADLTDELEKLDIDITKLELVRLNIEENKIKKEIVDEEDRQVVGMNNEDENRFRKLLLAHKSIYFSQQLSKRNKVKNKKFKV